MAVIVTCPSESLTFVNGSPVCAEEWTTYEYSEVATLSQVMEEYLAFDGEIFGIVTGFLLVSWIVSFFTGKVARVLGRV